MGPLFTCTTETVQPYGYKKIILADNHQSISILTEFGSNLSAFMVDGMEFLMGPETSAYQDDKFGIPILFPTPNRVRNGSFAFQGKQYDMIKDGEPLLIHGFARNEAWEHEEPEAGENHARVTTYLEVNRDHPIYNTFPFCHRIRLTYQLEVNGFSIEYQVENLDKKDLPFGVGLHPYFLKLGSLNRILIQVPAEYVMESIDLMPTGEIRQVQGTAYDLIQPKILGPLDINDTYWKMDSSLQAAIIYEDLGRKLVIQASDDFSHMVVFTPHDKPYFCLENQTCSADAHNLYDQGKGEISGLIVIRPGEAHKGWVKITHHYL